MGVSSFFSNCLSLFCVTVRYLGEDNIANSDLLFEKERVMERLFAAVLWPAFCVAGVWFVLTGSLLPVAIIAMAVISVVMCLSKVGNHF